MLYVCATPIGNLNDISLRAIDMLRQADIILCEDTRTSSKLLKHYEINHNRLIALHEHNENEISQKVLEWLAHGATIVQISDAGTPGVSDPGARLCNTLFAHGITPHPLPGACAYICLLAVSGLIETPSLFFGFLPAKSLARQKQLTKWLHTDYAVAIYESPHRILGCLRDINLILGTERTLVMGRELTKQFETIRKCAAHELLNQLLSDPNQQRGEFVLLILPPAKQAEQELSLSPQLEQALTLIATELPAKKAVNLAHKLFGGDKDLMYQYLSSKKSEQFQSLAT